MINIEMAILLLFGMSLLFTSCKNDSFDMEQISTVKTLPDSHKKFIVEFYPNAVEANQKIMLDRAWLLNLRDDFYHVTVKGHQMEKLNELALNYKLKGLTFDNNIARADYKMMIDSLLYMVDYIPEKLVLAQAIVESGWGKSGFSDEINNYFGIRCYTPGCGVQPSGVDSPSFWVKAYPSKEACIEEYIWLLNTGFAYTSLRAKRFELRKSGEYPNALLLAQGLERYSEKGSEYINLVQSIIENYLPADLGEFVKYVQAGEPEI